MNQFDNYELTTMDYALKYYLEHNEMLEDDDIEWCNICLLYTSPSPRDERLSRMPSSA